MKTEEIEHAANLEFPKRHSGFINEQYEMDISRKKYIQGFKKGAEWAIKQTELSNPPQPENKEVMSLEFTLGELLMEYASETPKQLGDYQERSYPISTVMKIADRYASQFQSRIKELEAEVERLKARL